MILPAHELRAGLRFLTLVCFLPIAMHGTSQAAVNLVTNPGFETGDFTGWTKPADSTFVVVANPPSVLAPHGGTYEAKSGPNTLEFLSQTIATTAGHTYEVSFWLAEFISFNANLSDNTAMFTASFAGQPLTSITTVTTNQTPQSNVYTEYVYDVKATGATSTLQFGFKDPPAYWLLDDVSVTDTPEASSLVVWSMLGLVGVAVGIARRQCGVQVA